MSKRHTSLRGRENRQHSRSELRRAARSDGFVPFGLRRRLSFESQQPILESFRILREDGVIAEEIVPRPTLHVTEMPLTQIQKQLSRGIVIGYELGRKSVRTRDQIVSEFSGRCIAAIGEPGLFKKRHLGFRVHSEELEEEYRDIRLELGGIGIKGTMRDVTPLHITCGTVEGNLRRSELYRAIDALSEIRATDQSATWEAAELFVPSHVTLDPVEFYPGKY